ncbi:hypothetical protein E4U21_000194 [Claviceps maximensis]|nr:hypothetical protein E4U21_000194 [Claviceps maximensis]
MSSTMMMRPHPVAAAATLERMPDLYSIPEDGIYRKNSPLSPRPSTACETTTAAYPMYPGLQTPKMDRTRSADSLPITLHRPRKPSGTRTEPTWAGSRPPLVSSMSMQTMRSSSWDRAFNNINGYDQIETRMRRTTSFMPTRTPPLLKKQNGSRSRALLGDLCSALPGEVIEVILEMLKQLHLDRASESCATCWMRDVSSAALCSRKWYKAARLVLYQDVQLIGSDSAAHKKKFKMTQGCRMTLLRRTLRANTEIASMVRSLKVPAPESMTASSALPSSSSSSSLSSPSGFKGQALLEQYENQVASVVMACPNLERLSGPICSYNHSFKRLFQALSTRKNLKDMHWVLDASEASSTLQHRQAAVSAPTKHNALLSNQDQNHEQAQAKALAQNQLQPHEEVAFLEHHTMWTKLTSLSIQCLPGVVLASPTIFTKTMALLPSLQHLHLHDLASSAFNDSNLVDLPPLKSLTLSNIRGISSNGLSAFATRTNSQPLRRLVLRHTPLTSLPALARILSNLGSLTSLSLVQTFPPLMPDSDSFVLWMMPYLASSSVSKLHWDITSHPDSVNAADDILARSIAAGGFPALRVLRTPNDPEGVFQQLCRPLARIDQPTDRFRVRGMSVSERESTSPSASSPPKFLIKSSTTSSLQNLMNPVPHTSLVTARLAAQARLESARDREAHQFQVNVTDEEGHVVDAFCLGGYIGTVGSQIEYHLFPDAGSTDEQGGLVDVSALRGSNGESPAPGSQGCTGSWNRREGTVADKKEKERWWHTERGRWSSLYL